MIVWLMIYSNDASYIVPYFQKMLTSRKVTLLNSSTVKDSLMILTITVEHRIRDMILLVLFVMLVY
uniref:Putative disease resistance protein At1g52660 n=1 Tax=Rhizophora mucronata TaxID=61149 RepID=A0A2P2LU35_RHIMU